MAASMTADAQWITVTRVEKRLIARRRARLAVAAVGVFALLCSAGIASVAGAAEPRVAPGTFVAGIDVGGLSRTQAVAVLRDRLAWERRTIVLRADTGGDSGELRRVVPLAELGVIPEVEETVRRLPTTYLPLRRPGNTRREASLVVNVDDSIFGEALERCRSLLERPPCNARMLIDDDNYVRIIGETPGLHVNAEKMREALLNRGEWAALLSEMEVPLDHVLPEVTAESLQELGIKGKVASFSTAHNKDADRTENIRIAARKLDNYVLGPGEVFSFNEVVGPRVPEDGYRETPVYWMDEVRRGFGGGVCQLSTTLYNVVLLANLEVVERHPHSLTVDYVPLGRDAAVSYGEVDFKFRNNTPNHVLIRADVSGGMVNVSMFGDVGTPARVEIRTEVLKKIDFGEEVIEDPAIPEGRMLVRDGKPGYVVRSERIVYADGKQVSKESLGVSSYLPLARQVKVGPGTQPSSVASRRVPSSRGGGAERGGI